MPATIPLAPPALPLPVLLMMLSPLCGDNFSGLTSLSSSGTRAIGSHEESLNSFLQHMEKLDASGRDGRSLPFSWSAWWLCTWRKCYHLYIKSAVTPNVKMCEVAIPDCHSVLTGEVVERFSLNLHYKIFFLIQVHPIPLLPGKIPVIHI